jgi:hypothetical protein
MSPNPQMTKISIGQIAKRHFRLRMNAHIGLTLWVVAADIQFFFTPIVMVDLRRRADHGNSTTIRTADSSGFTLFLSLHFAYLLFQPFALTTPSFFNLPPPFICELFVNKLFFG